MAVLFYDEPIFQTNRPGLTTVRWKKRTVVGGVIQDVTDWTTDGVTEVENGNYYLRVPIEDTDPDPLLIVADTGQGEVSFTKVVLALKFTPKTLVEAGSGGGILSAKIADSSLSPKDFLEIVQRESKVITFIVQAVGRFTHQSATTIQVKIADTKKHAILIGNDSIERVCEELDVQVIRATITAEQSDMLVDGLARIEISFDDQKAILKHALKIIEDIEIEGS